MNTPERHEVSRPPHGLSRVVIAFLLVLVGLSAASTEVSTTMSVGVRVVPVAHLTMDGPPSIAVTEQDIVRGTVDVMQPTQLHIRSNSRAGFVLNVWPASELFVSAELMGPDGVTAIGSSGASIVNRWKTSNREATLSVTHRFHLASGLTPGLYAWPLKYAVEPL